MKYVMLVLIAVLPLIAQEEGGSGGFYGYTAIQYDPSSNQVDAYSETDVDGGIDTYYHPLVQLSVSDNHGNYYNQYCSESGDGETYASASCTGIPGTGGYTYTAKGGHEVRYVIVIHCSGATSSPPPAFPVSNLETAASECKCGCGNNEYWLDPDYYDYFSSLGLDDPFGDDYFASGPSNDVYVESGTLGESFDTASTGPLPVCGDLRDSLIAQYATYLSSFRPGCDCFLTPTQWTGADEEFTFAYLTPDEDAPWAGSWAALLPKMGDSLEDVYDALGYPVNGLANQSGVVGSIPSGYRNPAAEKRAETNNKTRYFPNSRHMAGDAVDMRTMPASGNSTVSQTNYNNQRTAAKDNGACVEPYPKSAPHTHMDWRTSWTAPEFAYYYHAKLQCPPGW